MKAVRSRKTGMIAIFTPHRDPKVWETIEIDSFGKPTANAIEGQVVPEPKAIPAPKKAKSKKATATAISDTELDPENLLDGLEGLADELDT